MAAVFKPGGTFGLNRLRRQKFMTLLGGASVALLITAIAGP
jgi:hypothetical protein